MRGTCLHIRSRIRPDYMTVVTFVRSLYCWSELSRVSKRSCRANKRFLKNVGKRNSDFLKYIFTSRSDNGIWLEPAFNELLDTLLCHELCGSELGA